MKNKASRERLIFIILFIMIIIFLNFIISRHIIRIDLTEDKRYTISDSTKEILSGLDDMINIDVYFSRDLPPQFRNIEEEVRSLLDELMAYSGRNLLIEFHNPKDDPDMEYKLQTLQIPRVRANIIEKDRAQVVELYLGIAIYYQDKVEVIPVVQNIANLEYEILSRILKVITDHKHSIRLVYDPDRYHGTEAQMMGLNLLQAILSDDFNFEAVPYGENAVSHDIDLLLLLPVDEPNETFLYKLDQYILNGNAAAIFHGGMKVHPQIMAASPYDNKLLEMLKHYGINIDGSLVLDRSNSMASFQTEFGFFSTEYPFWVALRSENMNKSMPILSGLETVILPYVSPVLFSNDLPEADMEDKILFTSSEISYKKYSPINLNPQQDWQFRRNINGYIPLGIFINQKLTSFFEDNYDYNYREDFTQISPVNSNLMVIGSEHVLYDFFFQNNDNNIIFIRNLIDYFTVGEGLMGIRARQVIQRPLKELSETERAYIKWLTTLGIPVLLILFGIIKYIIKKRSRKIAMQR